jgi:hypothetical protein
LLLFLAQKANLGKNNNKIINKQLYGQGKCGGLMTVNAEVCEICVLDVS